MPPPTPLDPLAISNTLARYCTALDTKSYALLATVFTPDVEADYPFNRGLRGVDAVAKAVEGRYSPSFPSLLPPIHLSFLREQD